MNYQQNFALAIAQHYQHSLVLRNEVPRLLGRNASRQQLEETLSWFVPDWKMDGRPSSTTLRHWVKYREAAPISGASRTQFSFHVGWLHEENLPGSIYVILNADSSHAMRHWSTIFCFDAHAKSDWHWSCMIKDPVHLRQDPEFAEGPPPDDMRYLLALNGLPNPYRQAMIETLPLYLQSVIEQAPNRMEAGLPPDDSGRLDYKDVGVWGAP